MNTYVRDGVVYRFVTRAERQKFSKNEDVKYVNVFGHLESVVNGDTWFELPYIVPLDYVFSDNIDEFCGNEGIDIGMLKDLCDAHHLDYGNENLFLSLANITGRVQYLVYHSNLTGE